MLRNIKSFNLFGFVDSNSIKHNRQDVPDDDASDDGFGGDGNHANELNADLLEAMAGEQAGAGREDTHSQGSPDSAGAVYGPGSDGVINLETVDASPRKRQPAFQR